MTWSGVRLSPAARAAFLALYRGPGVVEPPLDHHSIVIDDKVAKVARARLLRGFVPDGEVEAEIVEALHLPSQDRPRFWGDGVDFDLLRVVPGAAEAMGRVRETKLRVQSGESYGRINHPSVWELDGVHTAFATTEEAFAELAAGESIAPRGFSSSDPAVACTFEELWRDAWDHGINVRVFGRTVIPGDRFRSGSLALMDLARGYTDADPQACHRIERATLRAIHRSAATMADTLAAWSARPPTVGRPRRLAQVWSPADAHADGPHPECPLCEAPVAPRGSWVYLWACGACGAVGCSDCTSAEGPCEKTCEPPRRRTVTHGLSTPAPAHEDADDIPF